MYDNKHWASATVLFTQRIRKMEDNEGGEGR
jgi:hypothetical protein